MKFSVAMTSIVVALSLWVTADETPGQSEGFTAVRAGVAFDRPLRRWDGFGFNYVETAHTYDPAAFPREYGGFSLLDEEEKREVVDLVFGDDGLRVGIVKMFLGPNHQSEPGGPFDHETTASHMRDFVRRGLRATRARGDDLEIITTLYGPPGFMTLRREDRGRDLDPDFADDLAL